MKIGVLGLGRMGGNIARRLIDAGHEYAVFDANAQATAAVAADGGHACDSLETLVENLPAPRTLWLMLPAGQITEETIARLTPLLEPAS